MMQPESERGAILIFVALVLVVMMGLAAYVVDYGVFWFARTQAQNAADAGALAGAVSRAYDEVPPAAAGAMTIGAATVTANANLILGVAGTPVVDASDDACPAFSPVTNGPCVDVDVFRDGTNNSTRFDAYFANVFGVTSQGIKAHAIAQALVANTSNCLKPWLIPDRFTDANGNALFDEATDVYIPPTDEDTTGYTLDNSLGTTIVMKAGTQGGIEPGNYFEIGDADVYKEGISGCQLTRSIGQTVPVLPGNRKGPTKQGVTDLIALDPNASYSNGTIVGSCAPSTCGAESPRLVSLAVYDPREYADLGFPNGSPYELTIVNILTLFIVGADNQGTVTGVFMRKSGALTAGGGTVPTGASWLKAITLIQ